MAAATLAFHSTALSSDRPADSVATPGAPTSSRSGASTSALEHAVRLEGVSKRYGNSTVLHSVDLKVRRGEFLTLLGPSGSGKSTILNMISGATPPTTGRVFLDGEDVTAKPPRERGLGMVFQNYALMPHMTVFENVAFPLKVRKESGGDIKRRVTETLERVGLSGFASRKPKELSGGQQQRVSIARCLVYSPSIILMDEPLGALDKKLRDQLQGEIKSLHRDIGTTLVYVTHDQEEALNLSDTICLMNHGKVEQLGSPADLYFAPANRFVADFVGESNILAGTLVEPDVFTTAAGARLRVTGRGATGGRQAEVLVRPENVRIVGPNDAATDDNVFDATVTQLSFVGGRTRVEAMVGSERILATRISARDDAAVRPGERIRLAWGRSHSIVLD